MNRSSDVLLGCIGVVIAALRHDEQGVTTLLADDTPELTADIARAAVLSLANTLRAAAPPSAIDQFITDLQKAAAEQAAA